MLPGLAAFCTVSMAGHTFGKILSPLGFPSITLFIFFGLLCGPAGMQLVSKTDYGILSWIGQMALGFIGLSAGGHFHVSEMSSAIGPALTMLGFLVVITYCGTLFSILNFGPHVIPFFGALGSGQQLAVALLVACLAVARSPSSAIAIISELNAKGPFTTVVLAVTVMMDVVVVVLFSISLMVARALDDPAAFLAESSSSPATAAAAARHARGGHEGVSGATTSSFTSSTISISELETSGANPISAAMPLDAGGLTLDAAPLPTAILIRRIGWIVLEDFSKKVLLSAFAGFLLGHMLPLRLWLGAAQALVADGARRCSACGDLCGDRHRAASPGRLAATSLHPHHRLAALLRGGDG